MGSEARTVTAENARALANWCHGKYVEEIDPFDDSNKFPGVNVPVGDSAERASLGDVILRYNDGTFQVFKG